MRWLFLALAGAILCTSLDHLHVTHGVLLYRSPVFWRQAWWVPLEFAAAAIAAVAGARPFVRRMAVPALSLLVADAIGFSTAYTLTAFMPWELGTLTSIILLTAFVVRVLAERMPPSLIVSCVGLALCGVTCEGLLSRSGAFHYVHPDFFGTPRWLAGIYLHAGLLTARLAAASP